MSNYKNTKLFPYHYHYYPTVPGVDRNTSILLAAVKRESHVKIMCAWCEEQWDNVGWINIGGQFYFLNEDMLLMFKLVWG